MTEYLRKELVDGLQAAHRAVERRKSRLRIRVGGQDFTVLRIWDDGFALDAEAAPRLRGLVDLYSGGQHLSQCLIVASTQEKGEMVYEFKRHTAALDSPPVDFVRDPSAPAGLIGKE